MSMPFDTLTLTRRRSAGFPLQQAADMSDANLGNGCSGNGISELSVTVLAATAQFARSLISEPVKDTKRNLRRAGKHQGGSRPFGYHLGAANGTGRARELVEDPDEQKARVAMRKMRATGFAISHETVHGILVRPEEGVL